MSFRAWSVLAALAVCCACQEEDPGTSGGRKRASIIGGAQPYKMVDELMADDLSRWKGKQLKVHGWVDAGSIREQVVDRRAQRTFLLQKGGKKLRVFSAGPRPDTFKDQAEVVVTGHLILASEKRELAQALGVTLDHEYAVDASELAAKCPSKYDGAPATGGRAPKFE